MAETDPNHLTPPPVSDNSAGRSRRLLEAVGAAFLSRGVLVVVSIISIPIAIRYLGPESFGVWTTISTFLAMLLVLDLGVANALTNFISEGYARNDREHASRYASTALFLMVALAVVLGLVAWLVWPMLDWYSIFHLSSRDEAPVVSSAVAAALVILLIDLPARLGVRILGGYQEVRTANLFAAIGSIGNLVSIIVLVHVRAGLPAMVAGSASALVGADVLCLLWLFWIHKPWLRPKVSHLDRAAAFRMMQLGTEFFLLQLAGLIVFNSDNLVVTHYLGPAEVARYSIAWRLVGYAAIVQTLIAPALWPAFAEAFDRNDMAWLRKTFRKTLWITMATAAGFVVILAAFGRWVIRIWATSAAVPTEALLLLMCVWVLISTFMNNTAIVLNAKGKTRLLAWCSVLAAALNLVLSIWFVRRIGSVGVILGTIISYVVVLVVPQTLQARKVLSPGTVREGEGNGFSRRDVAGHAADVERLSTTYNAGFTRRLSGSLRAAMREVLLFPTFPAGFAVFVRLLRAAGVLRPPHTGKQGTSKKIFVSHPYASVGDLVLLIPLLEKIGSAFPEAEIDIAVPRPVADLLAGVPRLHCLLLDDLKLLQKDTHKHDSWLRRVFYRYEIVSHLLVFSRRELGRQAYEFAIAPRWGSFATWPGVYLAYLSGAPQRVGYSSAVDGGELTSDGLLTVVCTGGNNEHESARNLGLLTKAGLVEESFNVREAVNQPMASLLRLAQQAQDSPDRVVAEAGSYAVLSPGATAPFRRWSPEYLTLTMRAIHQETGLRFYIVGGSGDASLCRSMAESAPECAVSVAGQTNLRQLVGLLAGARLFIGMDSGTGHLAAALAIPTVVISPFPLNSKMDHPNSPVRFRPCGPSVRVLQPEHPLPPCCPTCSLPEPHCIQQISSLSVVDAALKLLDTEMRQTGACALPVSE